ncbi:MAG: response regulator [Thermosynechococcaceae cyanobacterium]
MALNNFQVLLVEDDPGDAELTRIGLARTGMALDLKVVDNGQDALSYLRHEEGYADALRPNLILLDLNLPGLSGREVLQVVKQDQDFKSIPVIVLTTSDAEDDILETYALGANSYVRKPTDLQQFMQVVEQVQRFWLMTAELPPHNENAKRLHPTGH